MCDEQIQNVVKKGAREMTRSEGVAAPSLPAPQPWLGEEDHSVGAGSGTF